MSIFMYPIYNNMSSFKQLINATPSIIDGIFNQPCSNGI